MLFNSWGYLVFLSLGVSLYWLLPQRLRVWILALFSLAFYAMWRWDFTFLMIFSAVVDYTCAARIDATNDRASRKRWLLLSLSVNLGLLFAFKYFYFAMDNLSGALTLLGYGGPIPDYHALQIILPLGISFYTFQTISYTIDVYRGTLPSTRNFPAFLTYVTFWPQLIAGPILRASEVMPQLTSRRRFDSQLFTEGVVLVLAGLCKKVVLADTIAAQVDKAYLFDPQAMGALDVWVSAFLSGFQIYFDFSGYSDVAIGSALLLGIRFPRNFDWPYLSDSPKDFWQRWHISLGSWIRDYLYLPLTGKQYRTESTGGIGAAGSGTERGRTTALFATWFIMGLWHGAAWTFALWGVYHALLVYAYRVVGFLHRLPDRLPTFSVLLMLMLAMAGWIPFRAQSLEQTFTMWGKLINPLDYDWHVRILPGRFYLTALALTLGMFAFRAADSYLCRTDLPPIVRPAFTGLATAIMTLLVITYQRPVAQFIYFQF